MHNTLIEINSKQFVNNLQAIRQYLHAIGNRSEHPASNAVKICLPIKANAYGHGLVGIGQLAALHVDYLAVACLEEGRILRQAGINKPIMVFGGFVDDEIPSLIDQQLEITISSNYKADKVIAYCLANNKTCKVHIKVDTGMNRIGIRAENAPLLIEKIIQAKQLRLISVYSHCAASDEADRTFTDMQLARFLQVVKHVKAIDSSIICHLANSAALCKYPDTLLDMVRPGILSYGYFPTPKQQVPELLQQEIKPCFSLKSHVVYFKVVAKGEGISYNHRYVTDKMTRIITIPIGYGDGYRRSLSNIGEIILRTNKYTVAGTICMDMLMVDIGSNGTAYIGDEVVLIGKQGDLEITVEQLAQQLQTTAYEIICGFSNRIPRIFK